MPFFVKFLNFDANKGKIPFFVFPYLDSLLYHILPVTSFACLVGIRRLQEEKVPNRANSIEESHESGQYTFSNFIAGFHISGILLQFFSDFFEHFFSTLKLTSSLNREYVRHTDFTEKR